MLSTTIKASPNDKKSKIIAVQVTPNSPGQTETYLVEEFRQTKDRVHPFKPQICKKSARMIEERRKIS